MHLLACCAVLQHLSRSTTAVTHQAKRANGRRCGRADQKNAEETGADNKWLQLGMNLCPDPRPQTADLQILQPALP